jgi:predicted ribosomally synthesized peptide with SipW-like signal peptide
MPNHVAPDVARPIEDRRQSHVGMKLLITAVVLGLVGIVAGLGTWSAFSDTTENGGNSFQSGSVTIEDDDDGSAMFSLTGMKPGDPTVTRCIDVTYTGSLNAGVRMYGTTGGTGLAQYLNVTVTRGEKDSAFSGCGDFVADFGGVVRKPSDVGVPELAKLPRREVVADFHCVSGWTATDLQWGGVGFADFYRAFVEPALEADVTVSHLAFVGLDGVASVVEPQDVLADDVLLADSLDGRPLGGDHGAPIRLVSPAQYGYISVKHLCRVEVCSTLPTHRIDRSIIGRMIEGHPRARVWHEERHGHIPGRLIRPFYRTLIRPIRALCAKGAQDR